jgi:[phosphatase 2A protein]-leucine-carboxy methyltransferase
MTLPTLLISECCLVYLSPDHADAVLQYFEQFLPKSTPLATVIYEPIRPNDSFGRTMVSNLTARGIQLQTLEKYADLKEQKERLNQSGCGTGIGGGAEAADIDWIWKHWVDPKEKERVDGLEWMDEVEEFVLLGRHYCIAWGWRGFEMDNPWNHLRAPGG